MIKISFLGDMMCEKPFLNASRSKKVYDFTGFLEPCHNLFNKSDYIIGNMETPCDPNKAYTKDMYIFNAPVSFVQAIKDAGINMVTTATNHCLDRGVSGVINTIQVLDEAGLEHTGTIKDAKEKNYKVLTFEGGGRVAILSYTSGTNIMNNHIHMSDNELYHINLLTPHDSGRNWLYDEYSYSLRARLGRAIPDELRMNINKLIGRKYNFEYSDTLKQGDIVESYCEALKRTVEQARQDADVVVMCPHFGGQFNTEPGGYVAAFTDMFEKCGVDVVVGNHPHVVQRFEVRKSGMLVAYSLGNVSMSLNTPYILLDNIPDYSIMFHLYMDGGMIVKSSFSIMVEREDKSGFIKLYPVNALYEAEEESSRIQIRNKAKQIYCRFLGVNSNNFEISEEYMIE